MGARSSDSRRFPRGKRDAAQRSPVTRSRDIALIAFEVVLMEGRRKDETTGRDEGRGRARFVGIWVGRPER